MTPKVPIKKVSTQDFYWRMHPENKDLCLSCDNFLPLGCWMDDDTPYTESDCPIVKSKACSIKIPNINQRNALRSKHNREARATILKSLEVIIDKWGAMTATELARLSGQKIGTIWQWKRLGILESIPNPRGRAKYLISGVDWDSDFQIVGKHGMD